MRYRRHTTVDRCAHAGSVSADSPPSRRAREQGSVLQGPAEKAGPGADRVLARSSCFLGNYRLTFAYWTRATGVSFRARGRDNRATIVRPGSAGTRLKALRFLPVGIKKRPPR